MSRLVTVLYLVFAVLAGTPGKRVFAGRKEPLV